MIHSEIERSADNHDITAILEAHRDDPGACVDRLVPLVHDQLRRLAHAQSRRWRPGRTLCTTALVNEGYLKILGNERASWRNRGHFLAAASQAMRHILVDAARRRMTERRGAGQEVLPLFSEPLGEDNHAAEVIEVNDALERLAEVDPRLCRVVECRFFTGLTEEETALALDISTRTVHRDWLRARAWLRRELG